MRADREGRERRNARASGLRAREDRDRRGVKPEADAIALAMTAQIILCVLILLAAQLTKMTDADGFARIKSEYLSLVSSGENVSLANYFAELAGFASGFFTSVEGVIQDLMGNPEGQAVPEEAGMPPPEELGAGGGGSPIAFSVGESEMLTPPPGATLAPYFLTGRLRPPVEGIITSPFAFRVHPVRGGVDFHNGIDIAAPAGRGILAALPGRVERVGESEIYGKYVLLSHAYNLQTFYAHASEVFVREGMVIGQGERIARVGTTGLATGPHLHFSVIVEGLYADPLHALGRHIQMVE